MFRRVLAHEFFRSYCTLFLIAASAAVSVAREPALVDLANPLQGTDSIVSFSHGNLYPAIATPFPMSAWAPFTQPVPDSFYYQYRQLTIRGIRQTHQPSPWISDYGAFAVMPVAGELRLSDRDRGVEFSHDDETTRPSYYRVYLPQYDATIEVTPTARCASFRVTFGDKAPAYLVLDGFPGGSNVTVLPEQQQIVGESRFRSGGTPDNFANHFVVQFDQPMKSYGVWDRDGARAGDSALAGEWVGAFVEFDVSKSRVVTFRIASSYIDQDQAKVTLEREIGDDDFDAVLAKADAAWNKQLGIIEVEGGTLEQRQTFYSAMYRSSLFPHRFYEVDANGQNRYYSPYDGKVHQGVMYTDSGLWDTFRAVHPLLNLIAPKINAEILQGLLNAYDESGWLPAWASPGHRGCMIGNHAFSLFADAWVKGNRDFDAKKALAAMQHDANQPGPIGSIGREGAEYYRELGYLPSPDIREATAKTLEFAYDDYCASVLARELGDDELAEEFAENSQNWHNVFDAETGFVRGRKKDGSWVENFHPDEWGGPFTEGNSWHWTWCVFHDLDGLMEALGGREAFADKLDEVFEVPPTVRTGSYGGLIHEMTEMIALNMGQYAHGNQPIQHMIYLYVHAGQPWKAQARVREVMTEIYDPSPKGYCGDEDNGQTSAWYVFSAIGFYPVTPGHPTYILGSPLFDRATIHLPGGKKFVVQADDNGPEDVYIQSAKLNGKPLDRAWLMHDEVASGGTLQLQMGPEPNTTWATDADVRPPSF
ncbi:MAG: GH92 family glycosyl hydrolase [Planctomycetales bacterium]|nr:GH92 family glycosyl hydrolase [Planctomycetales bacterium]